MSVGVRQFLSHVENVVFVVRSSEKVRVTFVFVAPSVTAMNRGTSIRPLQTVSLCVV